ncbi:MAG: hypothetical protein ACYCZX_20745 [Rhodospirillaceae bacterium]
MIERHRRNPLVSWFIGLVFIIGGVAFVGWKMHSTQCGIPIGAALVVLIVMPVIYAALMYLTLKSQP